MNLSSLLNFLIASFLVINANPANKSESNAQDLTNSSTTTEEYCAAHQVMEQLLLTNPDLQEKNNELELAWEAHASSQNTSLNPPPPPNYLLPVVFHIIHENGAENISDPLVLQALQDLNDAFANTGYYDQGTGVDTEIQFCLAKRNPDGNPTTGINRVVSPLTELVLETEDIAMKDLSRWDPTNYINIWLVREICSASVGCGVAGYAYFPSSHGNPEDGIVMESSYAGSSQANSAVLAHEMGHYLGLYHTFQGGCTNTNCLTDGDRVCDTPPDQSTVPVPCNIDINSCSTDVNASDPNNPFVSDQNDMFWNYMDYGDLNCYSAFTTGQDDRMDFFIEGVRVSLLDSDACIDACPNPIFISVTPCDTLIEIGSNVTFVNTTTGATNFEWTVNNVLEATTTDFTYNFTNEGTYNVLLSAFNGDTNCIVSKELLVIATDCTGSAHVSDDIGSDVPTCGAPGTPCQTIQYALDNIICSGDTVFIHSGTYQLPAGQPNTVPIAKIPENYSVTFFGVEDNGPILIDGNNAHRGFQYNYTGLNCPDGNPNDGINVSNAINFAHLTIQNVYLQAYTCNNTNQVVGGGIQILNSSGSELAVSIRDCIFEDNFLEDPVPLNNNGRSVSGAAVYVNGLVSPQNAATTSATVVIDSCSFSNNRCHQLDNGGHGGAVYIGVCDSASITNSTFCNNNTFSANSDAGDLEHDRNAGGALLFFDNYNQFPGHEYIVSNCSFLGNSATTQNGASFSDQSEGGAVFLTRGDGLATVTNATLTISSSQFYDNNIETGIEHVDNNSGTLDLNSLGVNVFADQLEFDLGPDTSLCSGATLFAPLYIAGATYEWSTGETGPVIEVSSTGTYSVTVTAGQCSYSDDILIVIENCSLDCEDTYFQTIGTVDQDEGGMGMIPSADGNFYVKGYQGDVILITKMTPEGAVIWTRTLKVTNAVEERLHHMILDADGYLVGCGNGGSSNANFQGFIFKYDPNADVLLWSSQVNSQLRTSTLLEPSPTANYRVTGLSWSNSFPGQAEDGYILSIDRNTGALSGEVATSYNTGNTDGILSSTVHNGFIYGTGVYNQGTGIDNFRGFITKFDLLGNEEWSKYYIRPLSATARMYGTDIEIDQDSIVTAYYGDDAGTSFLTEKIYLTKTDIDGNLAWAKSYTYPGFTETFLQELVVIDDGYLITTYNRADPEQIAMLKIDKSGVVIWAKAYSTDGDETMNIPATKDQTIVVNDRIYVVGKTVAAGDSQGDILVLKLDMDGNLQDGCPFVSDLAVEMTPYANPFEGNVNVTAYDNSISITNPTAVMDTLTMVTAQSCLGACEEICDNGIDDDGDGLIDCYDPDCCESELCDDFYYNDCISSCEYEPATGDFELEEKWTTAGSDQPWCNFNTPITGDLDGDGIPEVIGKPCTADININVGDPFPDLLIVDGATGLVEATIATPGFYYLNDGPAIADVDQDGFPEIFIQASDNNFNANYSGGAIINGDVRRRILCYEFDGSNYVERWMSSIPAGYTVAEQALSVSVVDINSDGIPEVYVGNQIFNSLDGSFLVEGGANNHHGYKSVSGITGLAAAFTVVADVLPDNACADCEGLELVAGGMVYSISLDAFNPGNNIMTVEVTLPGALDGWVSIADMDQDGDLDGVTTTHDGIDGIMYVWDLQTPTVLVPNWTVSTGLALMSQPNIADFDGDGVPEIGVTTVERYQVMEIAGNILSELWAIQTDDTSGSTGSSVFDFNGDGVKEVVYRAESTMVVLDGGTGTELSSVPCLSGTRVDNPVVVDVDGDGATEILCSCVEGLKAFKSANLPWIGTRRLWNQHNYFNVNINEDLTVPLVQQAHHIVGDSLVLNHFLNQYADPDYPVADATVSAGEVTCNDDSLQVTLTICNIGENILTNETPVTFYDGNPTTSAATALITLLLDANVPVDSCIMQTFVIPEVYESPIYIVVNDDASLVGPFDLGNDFPVTSIAECDYTNNIDSILLDSMPPVLDLGPDTTICDNGVLELNAGSGFETYEWHDGTTDSTYLAYEAGEYWVEVTTYCGVQRDTIEITIDEPTIINLPDTIPLCGVPCTTLTVTDWYDTYEWFPADGLDCTTCSTVTACPDGPTTYTVLGSSLSGCFSIDTVMIIPVEPQENIIDTLVCLGETVVVGNLEIEIGETDTLFTIGELGCENTTIYNVGWNGGEATTTNIIGTACTNEFFVFNNVQIPPGGTAVFTYESYLGCDSIIQVEVLGLPTYDIDIPETICNGDSILIFGEFQTQSGTYTMTFDSENDCDSTINVILNVLPAITFNFAIQNTCTGTSEGSIMAIPSGGSGADYTYEWENGESSQTIMNLPTGDYTLTVTDGDGCTEEVTATVGEVDIQATTASGDVSCNGSSDGFIEVVNPLPLWTFSLNGGTAQADPLFDNLPAGDYMLEVFDGTGCSVILNPVVNEPSVIAVDLGPDVTITIGEDYQLQAQVNIPPPYTITWSPTNNLSCPDGEPNLNCLNPVISDLVDVTDYTVTVAAIGNPACNASATIRVTPFADCDKIYDLANAFTPDGDGVNDEFGVITEGLREVISFDVYNRWGKKVYGGTGLDASWNGTINGKPAASDVYLYMIRVVCPDREERLLSGEVTLIR